MSVVKHVKRIVETVTHVHITHSSRQGVNLYTDLRQLLPNLRVHLVFDVGANVGQSAQTYVDNFPRSTIYCFEPVDSTYQILQDRVRKHKNVLTFKLALGSNNGSGEMTLEGPSDQFYLGDSSTSFDSQLRERVLVQTLDSFCQAHAIPLIDYLKIDTEGSDLDVLRGAQQMLAEQRISVVEVEAGMNDGNRRHVLFDKLKVFLETKGYLLFGIYEQVHEWPTREPHLRRVNPVFISAQVMSANRLQA